MKFIHISDLHIGKRMAEFSLEKDQRHILSRIIDIVRSEKPAGVLIAGDIYDSSVPSNESYNILDWFLSELSGTGAETFVISGNHDSHDKLAYASGMFSRHGVHIASSLDGTIEVHELKKDGEAVGVYMLPFTKPSFVRSRHPEVATYTDAVRAAIGEIDIDPSRRNILIAHQFVTDGASSPVTSESESISVGGLDNVDCSVFDRFDYVALGHIHTPQWIGRETVRYSGTPLKYSKSECGVSKTVTVVDVGKDIAVSEIPLVPLRDVRTVRASLEDIIAAAKEDPEGRDDFVYAELTEPAVDAMEMLRSVYPNTVSVRDVSSEGGNEDVGFDAEGFGDNTDVRSVFADFFEKKNGTPLTDEQKAVLDTIFEEAGL